MTLDDVKKYIRVDSSDDDALIQSQIVAATKYIERTTGKECKQDDEVWDSAIRMLVCHWYENRGAEITGTISTKISHTLDALINHISMCSDYTPKVVVTS
jgi:uncharacterized phage protein (predicted DNA packaging)